MNTVEPESYFDGGMLGCIGIHFLKWLITIVSLTIALPWAVCMEKRWYVRHVVVDGQRLVFDGKGIQLWGTYWKWFILSILTLTIYAWRLPIRYRQWLAKHTHPDNSIVIKE